MTWSDTRVDDEPTPTSLGDADAQPTSPCRFAVWTLGCCHAGDDGSDGCECDAPRRAECECDSGDAACSGEGSVGCDDDDSGTPSREGHAKPCCTTVDDC
jgi:hypothetical protein